MAQELMAPQQRRKFLQILAGGIGVLLAAAAGWPLLRFLAPPGGGDASDQVAINREEVAPGSAHLFQYKGRPAVVLQPSPGDFIALSVVCTHLGCIVQWQENENLFLCPCHAGRFAADGTVISGPPPEPLESLPVTLEGDQILVG